MFVMYCGDNVEKLTDVELEDEINEYDENLYEVLEDYVTDTDLYSITRVHTLLEEAK